MPYFLLQEFAEKKFHSKCYRLSIRHFVILITMVLQKTLFNDENDEKDKEHLRELKKEVKPLEKLKTLEDKIANAIDKVKTLKEEKMITERRIQELEGLLNEKNIEIEQLKTERNLVKSQLEALLNEIEALEVE